MRKFKKWMTIVLTAVALTSLFSGCGKMDSIIENKEVDVTKPVKKENVTSGVYILTEDGKFYKANTLNQSFSSATSSVSSSRYIYSVDGNKYIPKLYKDDLLIYVSNATLPDEINVEKFKSMGYTIGAVNVGKGTSGTYSVTTENCIDGSDFATQVSNEIGNAKSLVIKKIAGSTLKADRITDTGTITGLEKDKEITIDAYAGTYYKEIKTKADTKIFVSSKLFTIEDMELTKNGYVILNQNFGEGYYNINNEGLIQIVDENRP